MISIRKNTFETNDSSLETWQAIKSYSGEGVPMTYLSGGFIKTNYDILIDAQMELRGYIQNPIKSVEVLHEVLQWYHITEEQLLLYRNNQIKR